MEPVIKVHKYNYSQSKRIVDLLISLIGLIFLSPAFLIIPLLLKFASKGPVFFYQKRSGFKGKPFKIYMFRTMYVGAENDQKKYTHLNEADGPVFKIKDDPRFVGIGKFFNLT